MSEGKKAGRSKDTKAGLQFPVGTIIGRFLKKGKRATRVGAGAPVYSLLYWNTELPKYLSWLEMRPVTTRSAVWYLVIFSSQSEMMRSSTSCLVKWPFLKEVCSQYSLGSYSCKIPKVWEDNSPAKKSPKKVKALWNFHMKTNTIRCLRTPPRLRILLILVDYYLSWRNNFKNYFLIHTLCALYYKIMIPIVRHAA